MRIIVKGADLSYKRNKVEVMFEIAKYITVNYAIPIAVDAGTNTLIQSTHLLNMQSKAIASLLPAIRLMRQVYADDVQWRLKPYGEDFIFILENTHVNSSEIHPLQIPQHYSRG